MVCLTEETAGTLYLLGEQDHIVGISGYVVRPPQARREKPRVSAFTSANIDKILALKPDLVLTFSDLQQISLPISFAGGSTSMPLISEPAPPVLTKCPSWNHLRE
jgi:ABC-type Fe3+-hydroxamate transport system substrate-binding protein